MLQRQQREGDLREEVARDCFLKGSSCNFVDVDMKLCDGTQTAEIEDHCDALRLEAKKAGSRYQTFTLVVCEVAVSSQGGGHCEVPEICVEQPSHGVSLVLQFLAAHQLVPLSAVME